LSKKKFEGVHKRGLKVTKRKMKGRGVLANFGTDGDGWEDGGQDVDLVIREGPKRGDVEWGEVV